MLRSARFVGGLTPPPPSGASQPPSLYWSPRKIVKISQKYIPDPLWFSHKSSTDVTRSYRGYRYMAIFILFYLAFMQRFSER